MQNIRYLFYFNLYELIDLKQKQMLFKEVKNRLCTLYNILEVNVEYYIPQILCCLYCIVQHPQSYQLCY